MEKANPKTEYNAAYVKTLETTVQQQKDEIVRLQQKLERMNELLLNAQRARFGQSSEKKDIPARFWSVEKWRSPTTSPRTRSARL